MKVYRRVAENALRKLRPADRHGDTVCDRRVDARGQLLRAALRVAGGVRHEPTDWGL